MRTQQWNHGLDRTHLQVSQLQHCCTRTDNWKRDLQLWQATSSLQKNGQGGWLLRRSSCTMRSSRMMADILTEGSFIRDEGNHDLSQVNTMSNSMFSSSHLVNQIKDPRTMSKRPSEIMSAAVLLFFFLQVQLIDSYVWLPIVHNTLPDIDLESARSHAKSESWKKTQPAF